jgi:hypothetical protein
MSLELSVSSTLIRRSMGTTRRSADFSARRQERFHVFAGYEFTVSKVEDNRRILSLTAVKSSDIGLNGNEERAADGIVSPSKLADPLSY